MMYTVYFLVLFAVNSEGAVIEEQTILKTRFPKVCELNREIVVRTISVPKDVTLHARCIPEVRTEV